MWCKTEKRISLGRFLFNPAGLKALVIGCLVFVCLSARGQSQPGSAEACFDQGPDRLPALPTASIPPTPLPIAQSPSIRAARLAPLRTLAQAHFTPAGFSPLKALPVPLMNAPGKDRRKPPLKKPAELLAQSH